LPDSLIPSLDAEPQKHTVSFPLINQLFCLPTENVFLQQSDPDILCRKQKFLSHWSYK